MPYSPTQMGAGNPMPDEAGTAMPADHEEGQEHEGMESQTMFIDPEMLPPGMDVKSGDVLEFKVVGKNEDGGIQVEYNHEDEGKDKSQFGDGLKEAMGEDKFY